jgi:hypothetical protein
MGRLWAVLAATALVLTISILVATGLLSDGLLAGSIFVIIAVPAGGALLLLSRMAPPADPSADSGWPAGLEPSGGRPGQGRPRTVGQASSTVDLLE